MALQTSGPPLKAESAERRGRCRSGRPDTPTWRWSAT